MYDTIESAHRLLNALSTMENLTPSVLEARTELEMSLSGHKTYRTKRAESKARMAHKRNVKSATSALVQSRHVQRQLINTLTNAQTLQNKSYHDRELASAPKGMEHMTPPFSVSKDQLAGFDLISRHIARYIWGRKNPGAAYPLDSLKNSKPFKAIYSDEYCARRIKDLKPFIQTPNNQTP